MPETGQSDHEEVYDITELPSYYLNAPIKVALTHVYDEENKGWHWHAETVEPFMVVSNGTLRDEVIDIMIQMFEDYASNFGKSHGKDDVPEAESIARYAKLKSLLE